MRWSIVALVLAIIALASMSVGAQPVSFVVSLGQGGNIATVNADGSIKVDTSSHTGTSTVQGPGTAGTPSGGVLSVQGVSGGTAVPVSGTVTATLASNDPCQTPNITKKSAAVAITTAAATQLVGLVTSQIVYVCAFTATLTGTTPAVQFEYGTGTTCGTGTTVLTGAVAPTSGAVVTMGGAVTLFATIASNALCAVSTGTSPSIQGVLTYVQQ